MVIESADAGVLLAVAVDAQERLAEIDWSAVGGLRVRMGLHVGDLFERDGDLFGPTMNLAARVMSGAAGGQIVLTGDRSPAARRRRPGPPMSWAASASVGSSNR